MLYGNQALSHEGLEAGPPNWLFATPFLPKKTGCPRAAMVLDDGPVDVKSIVMLHNSQ